MFFLKNKWFLKEQKGLKKIEKKNIEKNIY
jgi:hypothetical protein